jgi:hydantoinase/carbamoylase family amidase
MLKQGGHAMVKDVSAGVADGPAIRLERLEARLAAVNRFGADGSGQGINRLSFSEADMQAREWLIEEIGKLGLAARMDAVGNVIGRWDTGSGSAVMVGSHLDSVPRGGTLDGVLGVIAALECVESAMEQDIAPAAPIEIVATSEEEGRFGGMLGAQAMAGCVDSGWFDSATDDSGTLMTDAMRAAGLDPAAYAQARRDPGEVKAFLELHIEQGPVLDCAAKAVGIVEGISGVFNWGVTLTGEANHAGTTPMELRRDAFRGLADFSAAIPAIIDEVGTPATRLTVGKVDLYPNFPHTVPGRAEFVIIGRDMDLTVMSTLAEACRERLDAVARSHGLELSLSEASWLEPTPCHPDIIAAFRRQARALGLDAPVMPSGAGHDAQVMASLTRAGMIFVPSRQGVSHAPEEYTERTHIETGCNLLLRTMLDVSERD